MHPIFVVWIHHKTQFWLSKLQRTVWNKTTSMWPSVPIYESLRECWHVCGSHSTHRGCSSSGTVTLTTVGYCLEEFERGAGHLCVLSKKVTRSAAGYFWDSIVMIRHLPSLFPCLSHTWDVRQAEGPCPKVAARHLRSAVVDADFQKPSFFSKVAVSFFRVEPGLSLLVYQAKFEVNLNSQPWRLTLKMVSKLY